MASLSVLYLFTLLISIWTRVSRTSLARNMCFLSRYSLYIFNMLRLQFSAFARFCSSRLRPVISFNFFALRFKLCPLFPDMEMFDTQFEKLLVTRFSTAGYFANSLRYFMMCAPVAPYLTINSSNSFTWLCASGVVYRISSSYGSIFAPHGQHSLVL